MRGSIVAGFFLFLLVMVALLVGGCGTPTPPPPTPSPLSSPSPTPPPPPTPTPTLPPPIPLIFRFPERVSALEPVTVTVELPGLAERDPQAQVWARIYPPGYGEPVWESPLRADGNGMFVSPEAVYFPLEMQPGYWRLSISVQSIASVIGAPFFRFQQEPVLLWDLTGQIPAEVHLLVPQIFVPVRQEGDQVAGVIVWRHGRERVELWWTPGPVEMLTQDTARMMEEATFPVVGNVEVLSVESVVWGKRPGFRFQERWYEGPAEALVVQASNHRLCLLRVWGNESETLPHLLREIQRTFRVK